MDRDNYSIKSVSFDIMVPEDYDEKDIFFMLTDACDNNDFIMLSTESGITIEDITDLYAEEDIEWAFDDMEEGLAMHENLSKNESYKDNDKMNRTSIIERLQKINRMLTEAEMSPEDRRESDLIRSMINKMQNRANAKFSPEEKAVMNKYGIDRNNWRRKLKVGGRDLNPDFDDTSHYVKRTKIDYHGDPYISSESKRNADTSKINYADRARKLKDREPNQVKRSTQSYWDDDIEYPLERAQYDNREINAHGDYRRYNDEYDTRFGTQDLNKYKDAYRNAVLKQPVRDMQYALKDRKDAQKDIDTAESEYQHEISDVNADYIDKIKKANQYRDSRVNWAKETRDRKLKNAPEQKKKAQAEIDALLKRNTANENLLRKLESLVNRLNEAEMSPEDQADSDIIRAVFYKLRNRKNARITREEQKVLDKYGINVQRGTDWHAAGLSVGSRDLTPNSDLGKRDKINYADRARKLPSRGSNQVNLGNLSIRGVDETGNDIEIPVDPKYWYDRNPLIADKKYQSNRDLNSHKYKGSKNLVNFERDAINNQAKIPYRNMQKALNARNHYQSELDDAQGRYDNKVNKAAQDRRDMIDRANWSYNTSVDYAKNELDHTLDIAPKYVKNYQDQIDNMLKKKDKNPDDEVNADLLV